MSAREAKLIDELRNKELKALTDAEFKAVKAEVESKGIRNLKGSAAQVVFAALRKRDEAMNKARTVAVGDMVSWNSSGGTARGKVEHVMREGVLGVPDSEFSIKAEKDDPAVLIRIFKDGKETETLVGHKMSTLKKSFEVTKHGSHDQKTHGAWSSGGMGSGQEKSMNAATDTVVEAYRNNNTGRVGVQAELGQAVKHHNKAVESLKAGKTAEASKHSLDSMKSLMNAARDAEGIDKTVLESSAQRYSELMVRALETEKVEKHGNHDQSEHGAWANGKYNTDDSEGEDMSEPKNYKGKKPKISYESNDTEGEFETNADDPKWMDDMDILRPPKRSPKK